MFDKKMKAVAVLFLLFLATISVAEARSFSYALYLHEVDGEPTVDIRSKLPKMHQRGLTIAQAISFLQTAPKGRGPNQIGILVDFGCDGSEILKVVNESSGMMLRFYQGFAADGLREILYEARSAQSKQPEVEQTPEAKGQGK